MYKLTVELIETNCPLEENVNRVNCRADDGSSTATCSVSILHQPSLGTHKVQDPMCTEVGADISSRSLKTPILGGPRDNKTLSPDDPDVRRVAEFALNRLNTFDENSKKRVLINVHQPRSYVIQVLK